MSILGDIAFGLVSYACPPIGTAELARSVANALLSPKPAVSASRQSIGSNQGNTVNIPAGCTRIPGGYKHLDGFHKHDGVMVVDVTKPNGKHLKTKDFVKVEGGPGVLVGYGGHDAHYDPHKGIVDNSTGKVLDGINNIDKITKASLGGLNPKDPHSYYDNRGFAENTFGDYDGAIRDETEAIAHDPKDATAYNNRGFAKDDSGDHTGAIGDYTEAITHDPKDATAYNNRGSAKIDSRDYQGAIQDETEAIALNPKYADAYDNRGVAKYNSGDNLGARKDYATADKLRSE